MYIVWSPKFGFGYIAPDLLFVKSTDNGSNFEPPVQLLNKTAGGSGREQGPFIGVSASENRVIVLSVMSDNHNFRSHIFVSGSSDNGTNFARTYATGKDRPYIVLADNVLYNLKDGFMISIPNFKSHESS